MSRAPNSESSWAVLSRSPSCDKPSLELSRTLSNPRRASSKIERAESPCLEPRKRARVKPNNDLEPKRAELRAKPSLILSPGLVKTVQAALIKSVGGKLMLKHVSSHEKNMLAPRRLNSAHVEMLTLTSESSVIDQRFLSAPPEPSPEPEPSRTKPSSEQSLESSPE